MELYFSPHSYGTNYEIISDGKVIQDHCLACSINKKCKSEKQFVQQEGSTYCWKCFEKIFGLKCVACLKLITGLNQITFIYFNNQAWHKECFYGSRNFFRRAEFEQEFRFS